MESSSTDYDEWAYEGGRTRFSLVAADGARSPLSVAYRIVVQIFHMNVRVELDALASIWVAPQELQSCPMKRKEPFRGRGFFYCSKSPQEGCIWRGKPDDGVAAGETLPRQTVSEYHKENHHQISIKENIS